MCFNNVKCVEHRKLLFKLQYSFCRPWEFAERSDRATCSFPHFTIWPLPLISTANGLSVVRHASQTSSSLDATTSELNMCQLADSFLLDRSVFALQVQWLSRNINKMQLCNRIYYSKVYWRLNMFRAAHRSSSGALNCIFRLWFLYPCGDRPLPWQQPVTTWVYIPEAANTV
jgi:hypothetical protein